MEASLTARGNALAPDLCEPLLGYRFWRVGRDGSLRCLATREVWEPGVNTARCWRRRHPAPARLCDCGFNALHMPPSGDRDGYHNAVIGALAAWGQVDVHRLGFRAELARVIALAQGGVSRPPPRHRLERATARYRIPLVDLAELPAVAEGFAQPLDRSLIPGRGPLPRW